MRTLADEITQEVNRGWREFIREKQAEYNRNYHMSAQLKDLRLVTRGRYKDRKVRLMGPADDMPGFFKCALPILKKRGGSLVESDESTEVVLAAGQLAEC